MKRQARPFVVEVRKKRGHVAQKASIWAGIDVARFAQEAEPSSVVIDAKGPTGGQEIAIENSPPITVESVGPSEVEPMDGFPDGDEEIEAARTAGVAADMANGSETDSSGSCCGRRRKQAVAALPRGERWKRRLPDVLLRRKRNV
ncbi:hypothetical protein [Mesorhizobium sp. STM 4661]|uniref:hypothetical protein n=1 Tax=Mesorhizobium sp. STM 4661 TaxID=1297570 RepID=UPI0002BF7139|nr:hypothetical protein [Mesorhizobium sp. STM 4661]CCV16358.1 conserved hypothetical protein [Mesorhizobium sp. STM 4661]